VSSSPKSKQYLYGDGIGYVELISASGSDLMVVNAARVSFDSEKTEVDERDAKLIKYLYDNRHTSPFEHCYLTFRIKAPLCVVRHHQRHRTWSYNEVSRRYTSVNLEFYLPSEFRGQHKSNRQASTSSTMDPVVYSMQGSTQEWPKKASEEVKKHTRKSVRLYDALIDKGVCREQARMCLPQNMYVHYFASANLLNTIKFIELRNKPEAQLETQLLAQGIEDILTDLYPETMKAFKGKK
jgi:thymidylate synthase (FAD)